MTESKIIDELNWRGLIFQSTPLNELETELNRSQISLYAGFDPTADSLHVGNLIPIIGLMRFQKYGHNPIILIGGATGLIGDPSGKEDERKLESTEIIRNRKQKIKKQILQIFNNFLENNSPLILDNYEWTKKIRLIDFLRDIGKYFSLNTMISKESVNERIESIQKGISFTEFSYMLLQAYDFYHLYSKYNCLLQIGGSDQWGNITTGLELIRKKLNRVAHAITFPLLTTTSGTKVGKTEKGAIWLDHDKTSPYSFYQYWINISDADVIRFLKYYTFLSKEEIKQLEEDHNKNPQKRIAQKKLAQEITRIVHGESDLTSAEESTNALFGKGDIRQLSQKILEELFEATSNEFLSEQTNSNLILDQLVASGISSSRSRAREDIKSGAISVNNKKITDIYYKFEKEDFLHRKYIVLKKGRKSYKVIKTRFHN